MKSQFGLAALLAASVTASAAISAEKWDMPMAYSDSNFHTQNGKAFAQCVGTATGGEIEITVHGGGSLFKGGEIKRAVKPIYGIDSIPFLASSFEASEKLSETVRPNLIKTLEEEGLHYLYSVPWPPQGFYFKKEVTSVADMKGIKFRAYNSATARLAELTGMVPTQVEAAEISQAFATGVVEAMISSGATGYDRKLWEHTSHFYAVDGWLPRNTVMVNQEAWEDLDEEVQNAVTGCAELAAYSGYWRSIQYTDFTLKGLADGGMTVGPANEELVEELKEIGAQMTEEWLEAAGDEGKKMVDAFLEE